MWGQKAPIVGKDLNFAKHSVAISRIMWCALCVELKTGTTRASKVENAIFWIRKHTPNPPTPEQPNLQKQNIRAEMPRAYLEVPEVKATFDDFFGTP